MNGWIKLEYNNFEHGEIYLIPDRLTVANRENKIKKIIKFIVWVAKFI